MAAASLTQLLPPMRCGYEASPPPRAGTPALLPTLALFLGVWGSSLGSQLTLGTRGTARCRGAVAQTDPPLPPGALKICCDLSEK